MFLGILAATSSGIVENTLKNIQIIREIEIMSFMNRVQFKML